MLRIPHPSCSSWRAPTQKSSRHRFFLPTQAGLQQSFFKVDWTIDPLTRKTQTPTCIKPYYFFDISSLFLRRQNSAFFLHGRDTKIIDTSFTFSRQNTNIIVSGVPIPKGEGSLDTRNGRFSLATLHPRQATFSSNFFFASVFFYDGVSVLSSIPYNGAADVFFCVLSSSSQEAGTSHMIQKSYHGCHGSTSSSTKILLDI